MTPSDWDKAISHLNATIAECVAIGMPGRFALQLTLIPLKKRYDDGERTQKLYDEIVECE